MLAVFLSTFLVNTKITFVYNFVAPLFSSTSRVIFWLSSRNKFDFPYVNLTLNQTAGWPIG